MMLLGRTQKTRTRRSMFANEGHVKSHIKVMHCSGMPRLHWQLAECFENRSLSSVGCFRSRCCLAHDKMPYRIFLHHPHTAWFALLSVFGKQRTYLLRHFHFAPLSVSLSENVFNFFLILKNCFFERHPSYQTFLLSILP